VSTIKIVFEKRNSQLVDLINRREDRISAYLFEVMSRILNRHEFHFESRAFIRLCHFHRLLEWNQIILLPMHQKQRWIIL